MMTAELLVQSIEPGQRLRGDLWLRSLWFKILLLVGFSLYFVSCAAKPDRQYSYSPATNVGAEVQKLRAEMDVAEGHQIALLAPDSFSRAKKSLEKTVDLQGAGASSDRILKELGLARGFYEQSQRVRARAQGELGMVLQAREKAISAGATRFEEPLFKRAEDRLFGLTRQMENESGVPGLFADSRVELQRTYLDLELRSLKKTHLGDAQMRMDEALKQGAKKYAPDSLARAQNRINEAEVAMESDRYNDSMIHPLVKRANDETERLLRVTDISRKTGRAGNEALAISVILRDERIKSLAEQREFEAQKTQREAREQAQVQSQELSRVRANAASAESELDMRRRVDESYLQAQNTFSPEEAEVFRQGNNLILRMKGIHFLAARSEVPAQSYETLTKVREVIAEMNASRVLVEGHTDSSGSANQNLALSRKRADAVAQYLKQQVSNRRMGGSSSQPEELQIEVKGYGDSRPLSSNRTSAGRSMNRRVDITIYPEFGPRP
jgi:outer membrane protein OmpA-like peptidoglycan-associated protein